MNARSKRTTHVTSGQPSHAAEEEVEGLVRAAVVTEQGISFALAILAHGGMSAIAARRDRAKKTAREAKTGLEYSVSALMAPEAAAGLFSGILPQAISDSLIAWMAESCPGTLVRMIALAGPHVGVVYEGSVLRAALAGLH